MSLLGWGGIFDDGDLSRLDVFFSSLFVEVLSTRNTHIPSGYCMTNITMENGP